ncbi:zf-HC2 domain-containing protein [Paucibacter sp. B2R-40]|uniref:anti-sigma factor family protein n=1 Tax=Paucibacter sp. B2R-40 TaxID=2893554 RepID=UPI0021E494DB|nr:zf-HC2 domain-containing protein [Paucibacter sp. B2R-40]MCV2355555.1 zf-HC2 domain-containing protein [Paucibacter sp. B2R-40]
MKLMPSCKDITHIVLAGEDRQLRAGERLLVRAHWMICSGCKNFGKQLGMMRQASARWRDCSKE